MEAPTSAVVCAPDFEVEFALFLQLVDEELQDKKKTDTFQENRPA